MVYAQLLIGFKKSKFEIRYTECVQAVIFKKVLIIWAMDKSL